MAFSFWLGRAEREHSLKLKFHEGAIGWSAALVMCAAAWLGAGVVVDVTLGPPAADSVFNAAIASIVIPWTFLMASYCWLGYALCPAGHTSGIARWSLSWAVETAALAVSVA